MKYKNIPMAIILCASLTQQPILGMTPENWTNYFSRKAQETQQYLSSGMTKFSHQITKINNAIRNWSNSAKISLFLAASGMLITLGYHKEALIDAINQGIDSAGNVLKAGAQIIQQNPKTTAAVGLAGMGIGIGGKLISSRTNKNDDSIANYVHLLLHDPELQEKDKHGNTNYNKYIEHIAVKLYELLDKQNTLQEDNEYEQNLIALEQITDYETTEVIKKKFDYIDPNFRTKLQDHYNLPKGYTWLTIAEVFKALYGTLNKPI